MTRKIQETIKSINYKIIFFHLYSGKCNTHRYHSQQTLSVSNYTLIQHDSIEFSMQTFDRWRSFLTRDAHTHLVYSTIVLFLLSHSSHLQLIILRDAIVIPVR